MIRVYLIFIFFNFFTTSIVAQADSTLIDNAAATETVLPKYAKAESLAYEDAPPALGEVFKPKVSLGIGMLSFHGDLYSKHMQAPWTARIGYDLTISQQLFKSVQLNFNVLFGKLAANEWIDKRQENFVSEIRAGGLSLMYDFGNFIPERCKVRPWISIGVNSFEFLSKTDRFDKSGNEYFYWTDGSIKNIVEGAPTASLAVNLNRDYIYETDIREANKDGFGKYQERAWAFPIGAGAIMKVTDRFDVKFGFQYYISTTDFIDGISKNSLGNRAGTKQKDNFLYSSFALQYDLVIKRKNKLDTLPDNYFDNVDILAIDNGDYDEDGVIDLTDKCHGTPKGVKVDAFGCPFDDDADGVANNEDDELQTLAGVSVNNRGVALTDDYWQNWYNVYTDSGNIVNNTQIVENYYATKKDSIRNATSTVTNNKNSTEYTIELAKYTGPVPNEEMAYLLSIGDVMSTVLPDNSTVIYTAGTYKEVTNATKRRDDFRKEGNKKAQVGYFKDGNLITLNDDEIASLIKNQAATNTSTNSVATNTASANTNTSSVNAVATKTNSVNSKNTGSTKNNSPSFDTESNQFAKGDVVFRVQLGAYANRISKGVFKNVGSVLELMSDDNVFRYATKGFKTIGEAAILRADLVVEGYGDAFITAYKDGKRIPLSQTKATMQTKEKENIAEIPKFSSIDKNQIVFKIQLGALRKSGNNDMEDKTKAIPDAEKQTTESGMIRYTAGSFSDYSKADAYRKDLADKGFIGSFVIAVFKGEIISIQEAQELLK